MLEEIIKFEESREMKEEDFNNLVQKKYDYYLKVKAFSEVKELKKLTGINPLEDKIQGIYNNYLIERSIKDIEALINSTGINPLEDKMQEIYGFCLDQRNLISVKRLRELTGINLSEEVAQKNYKCLFSVILSRNSGNSVYEITETISSTVNSTGIQFSEEIIQDIYFNFFKRGLFKTQNIKSFKEVTGIKPSEEVIQKAYSSILKEKDIIKLNGLREYTKIELSKENKELFLNYLQE
jgi:hypothetical protein